MPPNRWFRIRRHLEEMECYVPGEEGETDDEVETSNVVQTTQSTLSSGIVGEEDPNASFVIGSDGEKYYECREIFD